MIHDRLYLIVINTMNQCNKAFRILVMNDMDKVGDNLFWLIIVLNNTKRILSSLLMLGTLGNRFQGECHDPEK